MRINHCVVKYVEVERIALWLNGVIYNPFKAIVVDINICVHPLSVAVVGEKEAVKSIMNMIVTDIVGPATIGGAIHSTTFAARAFSLTPGLSKRTGLIEFIVFYQ